MLCSTKWGCSNRPVGGAQGTSQQQKWAKPRTASSVVLLSHSSLGLPLGTGLEGEDRPLPMNWYHQLKSHFHHGGHAACQLLWDKFDRRLQNKKGTRSICVHLHVWAHMSFYLHLCQINCGMSFSKATSKPTNPACIIQEIKNHQKVKSAAINRICSISPHLYR